LLIWHRGQEKFGKSEIDRPLAFRRRNRITTSGRQSGGWSRMYSSTTEVRSLG
jgi:hypothetical protein